MRWAKQLFGPQLVHDTTMEHHLLSQQTHMSEPSTAPPRRRQSGYSMVETVFVVGLTMVIAAIALPMMGNSLGNFRLSGDARSLNNAVSLARMQAASNFTKSRLYLDRSLNAHHVELFKNGAWVVQGGLIYLSSNAESYGFGSVSTAPPNTQATIAQSPQCQTAAGQAIANTSCVVFNSRGIPVDSTGAPYASNALYLTDGQFVYGVTVSATSLIRLWRTNASATPTWTQQ